MAPAPSTQPAAVRLSPYMLSMAPRARDPQVLCRLPVPEVRVQLQAVTHTTEPAKAEAMLREALELDPYCLDTYMGFCRLFVRLGRLREAENAALAALCMAAHAAGLETDWRAQQRSRYHWTRPGPAERYYLAALELLAAVRRMQGNINEHEAIVEKLAELGVTLERDKPSARIDSSSAAGVALSGELRAA